MCSYVTELVSCFCFNSVFRLSCSQIARYNLSELPLYQRGATCVYRLSLKGRLLLFYVTRLLFHGPICVASCSSLTRLQTRKNDSLLPLVRDSIKLCKELKISLLC